MCGGGGGGGLPYGKIQQNTRESSKSWSMGNEVGEGDFNVQCHEGKNGKMVHLKWRKIHQYSKSERGDA